MLEDGPNVDIPTLPAPTDDSPLEGPPQLYSRVRYLNMSGIANELRTFKRLLDSNQSRWRQEGIPMEHKVIISLLTLL